MAGRGGAGWAPGAGPVLGLACRHGLGKHHCLCQEGEWVPEEGQVTWRAWRGLDSGVLSLHLGGVGSRAWSHSRPPSCLGPHWGGALSGWAQAGATVAPQSLWSPLWSRFHLSASQASREEGAAQASRGHGQGVPFFRQPLRVPPGPPTPGLAAALPNGVSVKAPEVELGLSGEGPPRGPCATLFSPHGACPALGGVSSPLVDAGVGLGACTPVDGGL